MSRRVPRRLLGWEALEGRACPSVTGAAAYVVPVERLDPAALAHYTTALSDVAAGQDGIVFFGDSITEYFSDGAGASLWAGRIAPLGAVDFGVQEDTAEDVLWQVEHGEVAGHPRLAVVNVGTNDLNDGDSVDYTMAAIQAVVEEIQTLSPGTEVLLMGLFPRGGSATDPLRLAAEAVNATLATWAPTVGVGFLDIGPELTDANGTLTTDFLADDIHPDAAGYGVWAGAIEGLLVDTYASALNSGNAASTTGPSAAVGAGSATSSVSSAGGIAGIAADGNVWHYEADDYYNYGADADPWQVLGTLGNVVALVPSTNVLGQSELFAQLADGSVWVFDYAADAWSNTGGYFDRGSMIADSDGVVGIAPGGAVFQYARGLGWAQDGSLGDADSLVISTNLSGRSELFAQLADGSVWVYHWDTGGWAATGGALNPGSMIANSNGISGVAGQGTVYHYYDEGGWVRVGPITGAVSLVNSWGLSGNEELFAEMADAAVWVFNFATGAWTDTAGDFTPGTMIANSNGVSAIAGGTVYHYADGLGWIPIPSAHAFVSVTDATNSFARRTSSPARATAPCTSSRSSPPTAGPTSTDGSSSTTPFGLRRSS